MVVWVVSIRGLRNPARAPRIARNVWAEQDMRPLTVLHSSIGRNAQALCRSMHQL
jgi:hypothetical protein